MEYKKWDVLLGWTVFLNALVTYTLTIEPTVSFWDTGEYIATSAKLEVAHPPGAPLFQMIGAFFAIFAREAGQVAVMMNYVSCISSAFTILFLFWTITNLTQKLALQKGKITADKAIIVLGSGLVGALSFTYSDSFWFNATETEVYAMASFIMALLMWLGLKWMDNLKKPRANKWLLLICFIIGLTFGIQFMGFLTIPSLVLLFYFKNFKKITTKNFVLANVIAIAILFFVFKFSLTYTLRLFAWGEIFFVNQFGLPFNSGSLIIALGFLATFYFGLRFTRKKNLVFANTLTLCMLFLFLGFSSWLLLPIRASVHVGINENDPSDARKLLAYYNREQYPSTDSPFYGVYYTDRFAPSGGDEDDNPKYERDEKLGKYIIVNDYEDAVQGPNKRHIGLFPRMWSREHAENYIKFFGPLKFQIQPQYRSNAALTETMEEFKRGYANADIDDEGYVKFLNDFSKYIDVQPPSILDNLKYMFQYQFGYMYVRYFMWNFVGRQNDVQGRYDGNGQWLSGIKALDSVRLGSQESLPSDFLGNKARNTYFFLPLLLGIIGLMFQASSNPKQFWVLFVFFIFTGLAIQFYTNPPIFQPRERDYSLVGSFYAFTVWIGIGTYCLFDVFQKYIKAKAGALTAVALSLCAVPLVMVSQNWDDHDRSNRYTARASAKAYLDSTQRDAGAILFTIGDNDNFPLWYLQEIEGYRTDVRVIVTSYFATDWYIDQMKRKAYKSDPIPSQLTHDKYNYGSRDVIYYQGITDNRWDIKDFMDWISSDHPQTKFGHLLKMRGADLMEYPKSTQNMVYYPTNKIRILVNKKNVLESSLVKQKDSALIVDYIDIDLPDYLTKNRMMMLDIIANNDWERPIYFSGGSFDDAEYIWMKDYLQSDGLAYKLVPIKTAYDGGFKMGRVDTELSYDIVKKWDWGNSGNLDIYHDPQTRKQFGVTFRLSLAKLVEGLIEEKKMHKALEIIEIAMQNIPFERYGYYMFVEPFLEGYYKVGEYKKAQKLFEKLKKVYQEHLDYLAAMDLQEQYLKMEDIFSNLQGYQRSLEIFQEQDNAELAEKEENIFNSYFLKFQYLLQEYTPNMLQISEWEKRSFQNKNIDENTTQSMSDFILF
ncbi:DUF2723 domain-containing protein [Muricauda sp. JGD-17]|uniref:DUF2723 domain-containing protein n=1 Tax=Flagellimonas ochracea TaxID=2696472 RepID=A0A964TCH7_9FLAO|nr:DUF2723 domain-containing protein [Allomuricauda ochracea]NAY92338.1 DUF2723 domain-containing protein [Allomuricauda ochracea]